jgi:hypothetical protein
MRADGGSMPYVNIPVPEEHVEEVMAFVLRAMARAAIEPWDEASVGEFFAEIDESTRALLAFVARASASGRELFESEAASSLQLSVRETFGLMREVNERATRANRPTLITARLVTETLQNGRTVEKRVYSMPEDVAPLVAEADRADLLRDAGPGQEAPAP